MIRQVLFALLAIIVTVECYRSGPPRSACASMNPLGHRGRGLASSDLGFGIASKENIAPGEAVASKKIV